MHLDDAAWVGYRLAEILPIAAAEKQFCLELDDPIERLDALSPLASGANWIARRCACACPAAPTGAGQPERDGDADSPRQQPVAPAGRRSGRPKRHTRRTRRCGAFLQHAQHQHPSGVQPDRHRDIAGEHAGETQDQAHNEPSRNESKTNEDAPAARKSAATGRSRCPSLRCSGAIWSWQKNAARRTGERSAGRRSMVPTHARSPYAWRRGSRFLRAARRRIRNHPIRKMRAKLNASA